MRLSAFFFSLAIGVSISAAQMSVMAGDEPASKAEHVPDKAEKEAPHDKPHKEEHKSGEETPPEAASQDSKEAGEAAATEGEHGDEEAPKEGVAKKDPRCYAAEFAGPEDSDGDKAAAKDATHAGQEPAADNPPEAAAEGSEQAPETTVELVKYVEPTGPQPYDFVRELELAQDRIALGNEEAYTRQRALIADIERRLVDVPDDAWQHPKNSRAAIVFALSGGNPKILERLARLSPLPCVNEELLKGLLAYVHGLKEPAKKRLSKIDPRQLDQWTGAHVALAQAMLIAGEEPYKAIYYLDLVRIFAPGTLLEEAALRREAVITALIEDLEKFEMLSSQYLRRFKNSVYAPEFASRFAVAVTSRYAEEPKHFQRLATMISGLEMKDQQSLYLAITQAAIVRGRLKLTRMSAQKLAEIAEKAPELALQARLYHAAVELVTDRYDDAASKLRTIDRRKLDIRDRPLLDAALGLAVRLRLPPQVEGPLDGPPPVSSKQGKPVEFIKTDNVMTQAKAAIGTADTLLDGEKR